jgi:hypothetical protein
LETVYRYTIPYTSKLYRKGVRGDRYIYTMTRNHPDACDEKRNVPTEGYSWEFPSDRDAKNFLRRISENTKSHVID